MEKRIKDDWNVFLVVLLSVLTCGIYWLLGKSRQSFLLK